MMQETRVQSLGREVPLEKGMAIHSSILAWRIPWTEKPGGLQSKRSQLTHISMEIEPCAAIAASTTPAGVQGGVRRSVLQGIWWDRSLDSWDVFRNRFYDLNPCSLLIFREALNPFMVTSDRHE